MMIGLIRLIRKLNLVVSVLALPQACLGQLASESKPADELLTEVLLELDELSSSYCVRFRGNRTILSPNGDSLESIFGYSAVDQDGTQFHSWGFENLIEGPIGITWCDALRMAGGKRAFRMAQDVNISKNLTYRNEEEEDAWTHPELNPFGLVFGTAGDIPRRNSAFHKKIDSFLKAELLDSSLLKNGDIRGKWLSYTGKTEIVIDFGKEQEYRPVSFTVKFVDRSNPTMFNRILGSTKTSWGRFGPKNTLVPVKTVLGSEAFGNGTGELLIEWEWLPYSVWDKNQIDFKSLVESTEVNLRAPFESLFEQGHKK